MLKKPNIALAAWSSGIVSVGGVIGREIEFRLLKKKHQMQSHSEPYIHAY
jgi:hypothetical protein